MKLKKTQILVDDQVKVIAGRMRTLEPEVAEAADRLGVDLEVIVRMTSLSAKCVEAREKQNLTIKEVARQLKVPQYRIKAIESGRLGEVTPEALPRYVAHLGLERWAKKWAAANPELARQIGLTPPTPRRTRRGPKASFTGRWKIEDTQLWDRDFLDLFEPAHFTFGKKEIGNFAFGAVQGEMHCRFGERDGKPLVEFSWQGDDDGHDVCGRGWAMLEDADHISGRIYFHLGDDSWFKAVRSSEALV